VKERALIDAVTARLGARGSRLLAGPGDDAAVVRPGGVEVTSVDMLAEGVHFRRETHSAADIGHKALGSALSDIAAMGARPGEAYLGLALPAEIGEGFALEIVDAMELLAHRTGTAIAGGDVVTAGVLVLSVTVTGWTEGPDRLALRSGARPGDLVGVTGELGGSGAGLLVLDGTASELDAAARDRLVTRHRRPDPRLEAGRALAAAGVSAMIDVSDGVATDAAHVARASHVALVVELGRLPVAPGVTEVARAAGRDPSELAATAGEDYELLFTAPPTCRETAEAAARAAASSVTWLGRVEAGAGVRLVDAGGAAVALEGYEHSS
jgi:thiamine-monophosphate kinase